MYGIVEGEPFLVSARRDGQDSDRLVIRFECKEGMGILGIRKVGRQDPAPSSAYEEDDIEPASLRAGRFVHVLNSGQRQSYALSRLSPEVAGRLPPAAWIELKPQTEYGFRYLIAPEESLAPSTASIQIASEPSAEAPLAAEPAQAETAPAPSAAPVAPSGSPAALPPPQVPMSPPLALAALAALSKEQAIEALKTEMGKVDALQQRIHEIEGDLHKGRGRERDLLDLLGKWQAR